jgi:hypothetical protein
MARDITSVIGDVLGCVPPEQWSLIYKLDGLRKACAYTAPEQMRERWALLEQVLVEEIGTPTEEWHRAISQIVRGGDAQPTGETT